MEIFETFALMLMSSPIILFMMAWNLVWKGFALWRAAKNRSKVWFVVLLVVNTLGILEILYLFVFGRKKK